jgi:hypothetical protein
LGTLPEINTQEADVRKRTNVRKFPRKFPRKKNNPGRSLLRRMLSSTRVTPESLAFAGTGVKSDDHSEPFVSLNLAFGCKIAVGLSCGKLSCG